MRFTVSVAGRGDVNLFPRPALGVPWASAVPAQERVRLDTTTEEVRGIKEFDWLVTPRDSGRLAVPAIRYPYFNPYTERYEIAVTHPDTVRVAPGQLAAADTAKADATPPLVLRDVYRGTPRPPLFQSPFFLVIGLAGPLPALVLSARRRPRRRTARPIAAAELLRRLVRDQPDRGRTHDSRAVRAGTRRTIHTRPERIDVTGALAHTLRREGVTTGTAERAEQLLSALDRASFGGAVVSRDATTESAARAVTVYDAVIAEARPAPPRPRGRVAERPRSMPPGKTAVVVLLLATAITATGLLAQEIETSTTANAGREFAAGAASYRAGDYASAAAQFAAVTQLAPGAPDGWVNAGIAAWAAGDTADAVVAWQRGGRLEPEARDVREFLALVRAPQDGRRCTNPPHTGTVGRRRVACVLACSVRPGRVARRAQAARGLVCRRRPGRRRIGRGVGGRAGQRGCRSRASRGRRTECDAPLRPGSGRRAHLRLDAGDVALVLGTHGVWSDIRLDGDREGWIATAHLTSIARRAPVSH